MVVEQVYISPEAYLRQERDATFKSEFIDGEIIDMAGASTNHNVIKENVAILVGMHVRTNGKGCRSMSSDQRVNVPTNSLYAYPDVVVVCGPNQYLDEQHDTLTNPLLIVEVLSPGTAAFDRGDKFALYRHSATLQEYVLVDSEKIRADVFRKHPEEGYWFLADESDKETDTIALASIDFQLSMAAVYAETESVIRR